MSIEIKIYPSENLQSDECLLFHAHGSLTYDVFFDLTELYEYSFKTALDGTFASEYLSFSSGIPETITYTINDTDYVENIKQFCKYISEYEKIYYIYSLQKI